MDPVVISQILDYEVRASWWADKISWRWLQTCASRYFAWKVKRKYGRYLTSLEMKKRVLDRRET